LILDVIEGAFTSTSTSLGTRIRVHENKKSNAIQWHLFTFIRVVYESELSLNSTRTRRICTGHIFRKPVQADYIYVAV